MRVFFNRVLPLVLFPFFAVQGQVRVIEEAAIPYTGFLSKADFDQRFPGKLIEDPSNVEAGWYVVYEHQSLNYYFGPMPLESTGRDYLAQLRTVVEEAVALRPSIQDYKLELNQAPFESGQSGGSESNPDASESSESGEGAGGSPPPDPQPSIWTMIKRLFGF